MVEKGIEVEMIDKKKMAEFLLELSNRHEMPIDEDEYWLLHSIANHLKEQTQKTDDSIKQNLLKAFADHDYPITYPDGSHGRGMGYGDFEKLINDLT